MNYSQFITSQLSTNVFSLCGDSFLANKCIDYTKTMLGIENDYDVTYFDDENFSADSVITACEQLSFFAGKRLVIVKVNSINESDRQKLKNYIKNINSLCTLVFVDNKNIFDFLNIEKVILNLSDSEVVKFIIDNVSKEGKKIDYGTASELSNYCLKDLTKIQLEIKKLCAYVKEEIKIDDIKLLVPQTEELVVFELTTALGEKKYERSLQLLNKLMGSPEQNSKLFALLSVTFQRMFFASISKNMTDLEIANKFGVKEYAIKKCKQQCKNFSVVKLKNIVYKFCDVEFMIKSGKMNIQNALFYMVAFILE